MLEMVMGTVTTVMPTRRRVITRARRYQWRCGAFPAAFGATPNPDSSSDGDSSAIVPLAIVSADAEHEEQANKADEHDHPRQHVGRDPGPLESLRIIEVVDGE